MEFLKTCPLIEILLLPHNTTSILQPLDVGVNKSFKSYIKYKYMDWLIKFFDEKKTVPDLIKEERNRLLVNWIKESWNNIDNDIINNSFEFCGYNISEETEPGWKKFFQIK